MAQVPQAQKISEGLSNWPSSFSVTMKVRPKAKGKPKISIRPPQAPE
jgi:hypothetical protein